MPAVSAKQRMMMAIAEHHPEELYQRNRGALSMTHQQLHDYAATKGLRRRVGKALRHKKGKRHA